MLWLGVKVMEGIRYRYTQHGCEGTTRDTEFKNLFENTKSQIKSLLIKGRFKTDEEPVLCCGDDSGKKTATDCFASTSTATSVGFHTLEAQAAVMHDTVHEFLIHMGRNKAHGPCYSYEIETDDILVYPDENSSMEIVLSRKEEEDGGGMREENPFNLSIKEWNDLSKRTKIYILGDETVCRSDYRDYLVRRFDNNYEQTKRLFKDMSLKQTTACDRIAVVGPVRLLFDSNFDPINQKEEVICVSVAAPNFSAHNSATRNAYVTEGTPCMIKEEDKKRLVTDRLKVLWTTVLSSLEQHSVKYFCINAIGCGAFKGRGDKAVINLPNLYAETLRECITEKDYGLKVLFILIPIFTDNEKDNFNAFKNVFSEPWAKKSNVTVAISPKHSMLDIALTMAKSNEKVGILNPSDPMAVRSGYLGMFWDGGMGQYALEEVLALQTTLLAGHCGFNPGPWDGDVQWLQNGRKRSMEEE